eukprot:6098896-Ditylum_brightwellii.AAC.1
MEINDGRKNFCDILWGAAKFAKEFCVGLYLRSNVKGAVCVMLLNNALIFLFPVSHPNLLYKEVAV